MNDDRTNYPLLQKIRSEYRTQTRFVKALGMKGNGKVSGAVRGSYNPTEAEKQEWAAKLHCAVEDIFPAVEVKP